MQKLPLVARILLGLIFFVFGLNGFFHFLPLPPPEGDAAKAMLGGFMASGYFLPVLAGTQTISGALLLANRFVPLALTPLAPVIVQIILFHAFVAPAPGAWPVPILALVCAIDLARADRDSFAARLRAKVDPTA